MNTQTSLGSSFFNCSCRASFQKQWSSSQYLNYYVHVRAKLFKKLFSPKNLGMIAWLVILAKKNSRTTPLFSIRIESFQVTIKALFHTF